MEFRSENEFCFAKIPLYLEPTEADQANGTKLFHPDLKVDTGSRVRVVERLTNGVMFEFGHRLGCAPYWTLATISAPQVGAVAEPIGERQSVESCVIDMPRGDNLDDTVQHMGVIENPTGTSTPAPNLIFRARENSVKRNRPDSTMLEKEDVPCLTVNDVMARLDSLADAVKNNTDVLAQVSHELHLVNTKLDTTQVENRQERANLKSNISTELKLLHEAAEKRHVQTLKEFKCCIQAARTNVGMMGISSSVAPKNVRISTTPTVINETGSDINMDVDCSYLPPSSNASAIQNELNKTEDRSTQDSLKFIRTHPEKVPSWKDYKGKMCMALFCCKILYKYAKQQALHKVVFLERWLGYAFSDIEERMYMNLTMVQSQFPRVGLFRTLRELARRMCPDDFVSLEVLGSRKESETLVDFAIRLLSDIPICQDVAEKEIPRKALQYISSHEKDQNVDMELRRELLNSNKNIGTADITKDELLQIMEKVDRLRKLGTERLRHSIAKVDQEHDIIEKSTAANDQREILAAIYGLQNQVLTHKSSRAVCKKCGMEHDSKSPSGRLWPFCNSCFSRNRNERKSRNIFSQPPVTHAVCEDCKSPVQPGPGGRPFKKCSRCFLKSKSTKSISDIKSYSTIRLRDIENNVLRKQAELIGSKSICEITESGPYDQKRYRLAIKVTNMKKRGQIKALFDTGCNTEVLTEQACKQLGITHLIDRSIRHSARGVDNRELGVIGEVKATLHIGDVPYTSRFQVLERISGFDMMIGTKFMVSNNMMESIFGIAQKSLGKDNVQRGN